jgi:hypothetical protein
MARRKRPILLRPERFGDGIVAIHRYSKLEDEVIRAADDGKQDVTADFDACLLRVLMPDPDSDVIASLDGAAKGMVLDEKERGEVADLHARLVAVIERHNRRVDMNEEER